MPLLSPYIRNLRIKLVQKYVYGSVLDLGCGYEGVAYPILKPGVDAYYGIEFDEEAVEALQKKYPGAKFFAKDLDDDPLQFELKFDCILMVALIEHIFNQKHLMKEVLNCLKEDGQVIITTPTPLGDFVHEIGSYLGLFYKEATEGHIIIYNKKRFQILANQFGLVICKYELFEFGCNQLVILTKKPASDCLASA